MLVVYRYKGARGSVVTLYLARSGSDLEFVHERDNASRFGELEASELAARFGARAEAA